MYLCKNFFNVCKLDSMKKSFFVGVALGMFTVLTVNAQKSSSFAGTVKFSTTFGGDIDPKVHYPREQVYTILGNKIKIIDPRGITDILDGDEVTVVRLYDIPGYKSGYTMSKEEIEEPQSTKKYTYIKGEDTMTICGYLCTRYDVTVYDTEAEEEVKLIVYTTTQIGTDNKINNFEYPGLTGFPLYMESEHKGVKKTETAIEVKKTKVKPVDFLTPTAYKMFSGYTEWALFMNAAADREEEE